MSGENQETETLTPEVEVVSNSALSTIVSAEIDMQISTAKKYPRDLGRVLSNIKKLATITQDTAASCFFSIPRAGKYIQGNSIRFAEIVASQYGNVRTGYRVLEHNGKTIRAQGMCHDLETNYLFTAEEEKNITDKNGKIFNQDMITMTGKSCQAIALRNAIFKVIPMALLAEMEMEIKQVAIGKNVSIDIRWKNCVNKYASINITEKQLLDHIQITKYQELTDDDFVNLIGLFNAITKENIITAKEVFTKENSGKEIHDILGGALDGEGSENSAKNEDETKDPKATVAGATPAAVSGTLFNEQNKGKKDKSK